jgi:serine/threonine protein kinase
VVGQRIGHYEILELIGKGGMGAVYKARDNMLDRIVAIKMLHEYSLEDQENVERLHREARAAARLNHLNIVTIYEIGEDDERYYIVMEYVDGIDLKEMIKKSNILPIEQALNISIQVCQALDNAHRKGVVHRDIKSTNILVNKEGIVKVTDFGLARIVDAPTITRAGFIMGTIGYMSPEQVLGKSVDARSDIYSAGIIIYESLSGNLPFARSNIAAAIYARLNEVPKNLREINPYVPPALEKIIFKAIERDVNNRYQRIDDMLRDLKYVRNSLRGEAKYLLGEEGYPPYPPPEGIFEEDKLSQDRASTDKFSISAIEEAEDESIVTSLLKALKDEDSFKRSNAAELLGDEGDKRAIDPLIEALKDEDSLVRWFAAKSLGKLKAKKAAKALLKVVLEDEDDFVSKCAAEALEKIGNKDIIPPLKKSLENDDSSKRQISAYILGRIGDEEVVDLLINSARHDEDREVRGAAVDGLGNIRSDKSLEPLVQITMSDKDEAVRERAALAIASIGNKAIDILVKMLKDYRAEIRAEAIRTLERLGTAETVKPLIDVLNDRNSFVKRRAIIALGSVGDPRALTPLRELLRDLDMQTLAGRAIERIRSRFDRQ